MLNGRNATSTPHISAAYIVVDTNHSVVRQTFLRLQTMKT